MATPTPVLSRVAPLLLGLGLMLAPVALTAHSIVEAVDNTEYVANSLEPLIDDPEVQAQLVSQALEPLTEAFTSDAVVDLLIESSGLPGPVPEGISGLADALIQPLIDQLIAQIETTATEIVASEAFAESWRTAVGDSHRAFREAMLTDGEVTIELPLRPFMELVRDDIAESGFPGLERLPVPELSAPLFTIDTPEQWRERYQLAATWDPWLALLAIGLTGVGVWFSTRRDIAWMVIAIVTPLVTLGPVLGLRWWLAGLEQSLVSTAALALVAGPLSTATTVSVVVIVVSATGWFIERSRSRPIA